MANSFPKNGRICSQVQEKAWEKFCTCLCLHNSKILVLGGQDSLHLGKRGWGGKRRSSNVHFYCIPFAGKVGWERVLPGCPASRRQAVKLAQPTQLGDFQAKQFSFIFSQGELSGKTFPLKNKTKQNKTKITGCFPPFQYIWMRKCHCHSPATSAHPSAHTVLLTADSLSPTASHVSSSPSSLTNCVMALRHWHLSSSQRTSGFHRPLAQFIALPETRTTHFHQLPPHHKAPQPVQPHTANLALLELTRGIRTVFPFPPAPPLFWCCPSALPVASCPDSNHSGRRRPPFLLPFTPAVMKSWFLAGASRFCYVQTINNNHS